MKKQTELEQLPNPDDVLRRMLNTQPRPRVKPKPKLKARSETKRPAKQSGFFMGGNMKLLIAVFVLTLAGCDQLKCTEPIVPAPKFQMVSDNNGHVWKVDTQTGQAWACMVGVPVKARCFPAETQNQ